MKNTGSSSKIRRKQKLTADLQNVREKLAREKSRYEKLQRQLQKEDSDVKKLEGISITALFYSILGSKEQQLEKERQELLAAVLQYEQCKQVLRELTADENKLLKELKTLRGAEAEYAKLLQEKEKLILAAESPQVEILLTLAEELANLEANKRTGRSNYRRPGSFGQSDRGRRCLAEAPTTGGMGHAGRRYAGHGNKTLQNR